MAESVRPGVASAGLPRGSSELCGGDSDVTFGVEGPADPSIFKVVNPGNTAVNVN